MNSTYHIVPLSNGKFAVWRSTFTSDTWEADFDTEEEARRRYPAAR